MKLLIDTHALLWYCEGHEALSTSARKAIENPAHERFVSYATPWEVAIKLSLGKLDLSIPYNDFSPGVISANGFRFLAPNFSHYRTLIDLPFHHRDPFDRLLIAQAKTDGLTILTADTNIASYGVPTHW